ncbi:MAG: LolA family protein [Bacilli bacterium]
MKKWLTFAFALILVVGLTGCGMRTKDDVLGALNKKVEGMKGYKVEATLEVANKQDPQTYNIEIWHNKPNFYRVSLKNATRNQHQMIIRNESGVYVLTPALNKSFKFQSEWPLNTSQAYLFESLIRDIVKDPEATFEQVEENFVFTTKTNYPNAAQMPKQRITFSKTLVPLGVDIYNANDEVVVKVAFTNMRFDPSFESDDFDPDKNMRVSLTEMPAMAPIAGPLTVVYPAFIPANTVKESEQTLASELGDRTIIVYGGEKPFTLIQEKSAVLATTASIYTNGEPVDLGVAFGSVTDQSVSWSYNGVDYFVSSDTLSKDELIQVASSMEYVSEK